MYGVGASANTEIYPFRLCTIVVYRIDTSRVVWTAIDKATGKNATGNWSNDLGFTGWEPSATATPPQEYDLPMVEGVTAYGKNTYWKTQEGICFVNLAAHSESASIINQYTISTLPYGYRPNKSVYFAGHGFSEDGNRITLDMQINQSGNIIIWTQSPLKYCSCFVGFIATS